MDGETKSGPLTRQSDHLHTWKGGGTGRLCLETVSLIIANMCQANRGGVSLRPEGDALRGLLLGHTIHLRAVSYPTQCMGYDEMRECKM